MPITKKTAFASALPIAAFALGSALPMQSPKFPGGITPENTCAALRNAALESKRICGGGTESAICQDASKLMEMTKEYCAEVFKDELPSR